MIDSLHDARIEPMSVQMLGPDGQHAFMMPVGLLEFFASVGYPPPE
jgi:hypothetical protein